MSGYLVPQSCLDDLRSGIEQANAIAGIAAQYEPLSYDRMVLYTGKFDY